MMKYETIDHTADFGIRVFGSDLQDLFANAACAMYDLITDAHGSDEGSVEHGIRMTGDDWPDLMVNWLREILFFWTGREVLVTTVKMLSVSEYELTATVTIVPYDPERHIIQKEIKAVTYHQIQVCETETGWEATVIFDV